ncbi:hypothetical protein HHK36_018451 [Tetracentron sinense]|uniref:Uncharacterized protein n=1 Tax=Tetracentron sinense TaxID=13715 RepID=A0A834Z2A1_TETSI|nr:hypothetical protein HHK36_018451 [Tetracentron sinense]
MGGRSVYCAMRADAYRGRSNGVKRSLGLPKPDAKSVEEVSISFEQMMEPELWQKEQGRFTPTTSENDGQELAGCGSQGDGNRVVPDSPNANGAAEETQRDEEMLKPIVKRKYRFQFEAMWTRHGDYSEIVKRAWAPEGLGFPMFRVCQKIKATRRALRKWNWETFKDVNTEKTKLHSSIALIFNGDFNEDAREKKWSISKELDEILAREEVMRAQNSRIRKLFEGWMIDLYATIIRSSEFAVEIQSVGVPCNDQPGYIIAHRASICLGTLAIVAEAYAVLQAAFLAIEKSWSAVVVESDCLELLQSLISSSHPCSGFVQAITHDIKVVCNSISYVVFTFVRRDGNAESHEIAAKALKSFSVFGSSCPPCSKFVWDPGSKRSNSIDLPFPAGSNCTPPKLCPILSGELGHQSSPPIHPRSFQVSSPAILSVWRAVEPRRSRSPVIFSSEFSSIESAADPLSSLSFFLPKIHLHLSPPLSQAVTTSSEMSANQLEPSLRDILSVIKPSEEDYVTRVRIIEEFRAVVESVGSLRGATVKPFGSFISNLYTRWGDLDISVELPNASFVSSPGKKLKQNLLRDIFRALQMKGGALKLQLIPSARVPLLKFESNHSNISCDISISNMLGQIKSKLLFWMTEIDERFRDMVLLVKEWAKMQNINDPKCGTLNSYSLCLLVIFHFQTCVPAILPPLQEIYAGNIADDTTGVSFTLERHIQATCTANIARFRSDGLRRINHSSLSELFVSFFNKIEDPFEQHENASRAVSRNQLSKISDAFEGTYRRLLLVNQDRSSLIASLVRHQIRSQFVVSTPREVPSVHGGSRTPREVPSARGGSRTPRKVPSARGGGSTPREVPSADGGSRTPREVPSAHGGGSTAREVPSAHGRGRLGSRTQASAVSLSIQHLFQNMNLQPGTRPSTSSQRGRQVWRPKQSDQ